MWKPWQQARGWGHASNEHAIGNARSAATRLSRRRVEREEVELFLSDRATRPVPLPGVTPRPA